MSLIVRPSRPTLSSAYGSPVTARHQFADSLLDLLRSGQIPSTVAVKLEPQPRSSKDEGPDTRHESEVRPLPTRGG